MPKHSSAVALLHELAEGDAPWAIPVFCVAEFFRVVTHPRLFTPPTTPEKAVAAIQALLESPSARLLLPGSRYWPIFVRTALQGQATGNLVFNAQIVALCLEHGVETLISGDMGLRRFEGLSVVSI